MRPAVLRIIPSVSPYRQDTKGVLGMLSKSCLLAGLFAGLALLLSGCTPAVQCDEAMAEEQAWSGFSSDSSDVVDVEVLPNVTVTPRWIRTNVTTPVVRRPASRVILKPAVKKAMLEKQRELLKREILRIEKQLEQLGGMGK